MDGRQITVLKMANCSLSWASLMVIYKNGGQGYSFVDLIANYLTKKGNCYSYIDIALRELFFTGKHMEQTMTSRDFYKSSIENEGSKVRIRVREQQLFVDFADYYRIYSD